MSKLLKIMACAATVGLLAVSTAAPAQFSRYRGGSDEAVRACAHFAQRYGGRVRIADIDRRGYDRYRVHGYIQRGGYDRYDRYDRYGGYDRYNRGDPYDRYGGGYGYNRGHGRSFSCTATGYGRVTDFDVNGRDRW